MSDSDTEHEADSRVALFAADGAVVADIEVDGGGTLTLRLDADGAGRLACRLYKAAKVARGELPVRGRPN